MTSEERGKLLHNTISRLMEHFDTVQILVTYRADNGEWISQVQGDGNTYARVGATEEWLKCAKQQMHGDWTPGEEINPWEDQQGSPV